MALPHRYPLIFNPKARSHRGQRALRFLMEKANHFTLYATNHGDEARELAARFAAAGEPVVIAAGGDGTLNAVVCGLAGSKTALAVLPTGTMNVFARELGIPFDNLAKAFEVIERGFIREIDLFEANHAPFVQLAGVGFDAQVIEEFQRVPGVFRRDKIHHLQRVHRPQGDVQQITDGNGNDI